jgi:putative CocE/NonD family hydrolase
MLLDRLLKLPPRTSRTVRHRDVRMTMRDGVTLLADVYLPAKLSGQPTVLLRSPYGRGSVFGLMAQAFAHRGYVTVIQSCRGTYGSQGSFHPFFQESADGIDTVAWIENQPWFAGRLGLYGGSYMGQVQWAMAAELGDRLSAMAMSVTTSDFQEAIHDGGGFRLQDLLAWAHLLEHQERSHRLRNTIRERLFGDPLKRYYAQLPVHTIDVDALGRRVDFWRDWATGNPQDERWAPIRFTETINRIKTPTSMVTGWSDFLFAYQMRDFQALRAHGCTARMTVGQWTHASVGMIGESLRDALQWFDIHLKGARPARAQDLDRVKFWFNGPNNWREAAAWPPVDAQAVKLVLSADGRLCDNPIEPGIRSFTYDPSNPTPSLAGPMLANSKGRGDIRALCARSDVLSFDGPALEQALDIIGDVRVTLRTSSSHPHHDLFVCLCDVDPRGRTINITDGYARLRPALPAGTNARTTVLKASPVAWQVPRGHRLRLLVCGGAFPRFARNLGMDENDSGGVAMTPVDISLHCAAVDACQLSFLISPRNVTPAAA